jgi:hypothetical protein
VNSSVGLVARSASWHNFFRLGNRALNTNADVKQYIIGLVRLTATPVALPTSTNAQSLTEMHHLQARESAEAREGIAAFNEKRKTKLVELD